MSTFSERAMLVNLSIHGWTARKLDEEVTDDIHRSRGAARDAGAYTKRLVPAKALEPIKKAESALRGHHYSHTLPWSDSSERILPVAAYERYMDGMRTLMDHRERAVAHFIGEYRGLVEEARLRLNSMFREEDYPSPEELRARFRVDIKQWPFPDVRDFRVDLAEDQMASIRAGLAERTMAAERETVRECWRRLHEHLTRMNERLTVPAGEAGGRFTDTLVTGLQELANLLPLLNVTGDPALDRMAHEAKQRLVVPPDMLRTNAKVRSHTAASAREMLARMEHYAGNFNEGAQA